MSLKTFLRFFSLLLFIVLPLLTYSCNSFADNPPVKNKLEELNVLSLQVKALYEQNAFEKAKPVEKQIRKLSKDPTIKKIAQAQIKALKKLKLLKKSELKTQARLEYKKQKELKKEKVFQEKVRLESEKLAKANALKSQKKARLAKKKAAKQALVEKKKQEKTRKNALKARIAAQKSRKKLASQVSPKKQAKSDIKQLWLSMSTPATSDSEASALDTSVFTIDSSVKNVLDESVRYVQAPNEDVSFGLIRQRSLRLKFEATEEYNDNIYLRKDNTSYDFITHLVPGVYAASLTDTHALIGFYEADILLHAIHTKDTRINQTMGVKANLFKDRLVKVNISDTFRPTTDRATSETNNYIKRAHNNFDTNIRWDMSPKTSIGFTYENLLQNYISSGYEDFSYMRNTCSPIAYWHLSPKTSITGEYNLGLTHYYESSASSSIFHQGRVGVEGKLTPKSTIYLRSGYQYRHYYDATGKNTAGFVLDCRYDYALSPKTSLQLIAASHINESVFETERYFKSLNFYASMKHNLTNNFIFTLAGFYIRSDYPHAIVVAEQYGQSIKRSDNLYGGEVKIAYSFRNWLSAFAQYEYAIKDSNIRQLEYTNNKISCGLKLDF